MSDEASNRSEDTVVREMIDQLPLPKWLIAWKPLLAYFFSRFMPVTLALGGAAFFGNARLAQEDLVIELHREIVVELAAHRTAAEGDLREQRAWRNEVRDALKGK